MPTLSSLLARSSRTFGVGIEALPAPFRLEITVAYLLLRVSDYLEDSRELADREKVLLLNQWIAALDYSMPDIVTARPAIVERLAQAREDTPDAHVARNAATALGGLDALDAPAREIVARRVMETSAGMARWIERGPAFDTEADLDDYMHEVAGRVGLLLTELFALRMRAVRRARGRMMELAREYGLCLQTVNVIRGLHEDPGRGWVYLPRSFLPDPGMDPGEVFDPARRDAAMEALGRLVAKAAGHLPAALAFIQRIPRRRRGVRLFCLLPFLFAVRTLALSRDNPAVLERRTAMSRREVVAITRRARALAFSNRWIAWYGRRLWGGAIGPPAPRS